MPGMKKNIGVAACLIAVMVMVMAGVAFAAENVTVTGIVEDSGDGLVLLVGDQRYFLDGDVPEANPGDEITVTGIVEKGEDGTLYLIVESSGGQN